MTPQDPEYVIDEHLVRSFYRNRVSVMRGAGPLSYRDIWIDRDKPGKAKCIASAQKPHRAWAKAATHVRRQIAIKQNAEHTLRFILRLKRRPCRDCGGRFPHYVMEFDHTADNKKFSICTGWKKHSMADVKAEIRKCELVCCNCHRVRTFSRRQSRMSHLYRDTTILTVPATVPKES